MSEAEEPVPAGDSELGEAGMPVLGLQRSLLDTSQHQLRLPRPSTHLYWCYAAAVVSLALAVLFTVLFTKEPLRKDVTAHGWRVTGKASDAPWDVCSVLFYSDEACTKPVVVDSTARIVSSAVNGTNATHIFDPNNSCAQASLQLTTASDPSGFIGVEWPTKQAIKCISTTARPSTLARCSAYVFPPPGCSFFPACFVSNCDTQCCSAEYTSYYPTTYLVQHGGDGKWTDSFKSYYQYSSSSTLTWEETRNNPQWGRYLATFIVFYSVFGFLALFIPIYWCVTAWQRSKLDELEHDVRTGRALMWVSEDAQWRAFVRAEFSSKGRQRQSKPFWGFVVVGALAGALSPVIVKWKLGENRDVLTWKMAYMTICPGVFALTVLMFPAMILAVRYRYHKLKQHKLVAVVGENVVYFGQLFAFTTGFGTSMMAGRRTLIPQHTTLVYTPEEGWLLVCFYKRLRQAKPPQVKYTKCVLRIPVPEDKREELVGWLEKKTLFKFEHTQPQHYGHKLSLTEWRDGAKPAGVVSFSPLNNS